MLSDIMENMSDFNKVIVCDLDGTLALSKADLSQEMSEVICRVLERNLFAVISGAGFGQFKSQFLSHIKCGPERKKSLFIFPTNGSSCYGYRSDIDDWAVIYEEKLKEEDKEKIINSLNKAIEILDIDISNAFGDVIEDRGGQITFSGCGQKAPLEVKESWDKDNSKRKKIVNLIKDELSDFEVKIGGTTSIDITPKGIDKAYAISKIIEVLRCNKEDIVFFGDALFPGGNDESVKKTGILAVSVSGPEETRVEILKYI